MSKYLHKSHNVSVLIYHAVCPAKYRRVVFEEEVDQELKRICLEISERYEIEFLEIGTDKDHVHFLMQSVPAYSPTKIMRTVKSLTAREISWTVAESQGKALGRGVLVEGLFYQHRRATRKRRERATLRKTAEPSGGVRATAPPAAKLV